MVIVILECVKSLQKKIKCKTDINISRKLSPLAIALNIRMICR